MTTLDILRSPVPNDWRSPTSAEMRDIRAAGFRVSASCMLIPKVRGIDYLAYLYRPGADDGWDRVPGLILRTE